MSTVVLYQGVIMLILIFVGMLCEKIGFLDEKSSKKLSSILLQIVNPVMIFLSYNKDFDPKYLTNLLSAVGFSVISFILCIIMSMLVYRKKEDREVEIERFSTIYSNCAFMGMPLINAVLGSDGVFYLTAYLTVFNLLVWSYGVIIMSGERTMKKVVKVFYSPTMIAIYLGLIVFFGGIKLPSLITDTLGYISNLNTPLAMFVAGATVYRSHPLKAFKMPRVYLVTAMKLFAAPLLTILVALVLPFDETVKETVIIASSAPSATMCTLFSLQYNRNSDYASKIFAFTTILSVVTMPLMITIYKCLNSMI